ncbi:MAG: hypothetical protein WA364_02550 [Candidatus Nitrosopolaris sp.]|jgi:hypothetical protein
MTDNNSSVNNDNINQQNDYKLIDKIDQKLIDLLLKGYTNKKIAFEANSPLSTYTKPNKKDIYLTHHQISFFYPR